MASIDPRPARAVFAQVVTDSVAACGVRPGPSPEAEAYLVGLLADRVRAPAAPRREDGGEPTLAESLLSARLETGAQRLRRMRALGDRALFVAGFFGDSLSRSLVDLDYYADVGRAAYADLACALDPAWAALFGELAGRWGTFVDVLAEVSDRSRSHRAVDLLRLYERYLRTGSARDRERLARLGHVPVPRSRSGWERRQ